MLIAISVIVGVATLVLTFKPMFGDLSGFWECVRFWLTPDAISLFRGEYGEDWWAEVKLFAWLACGAIMGFAVHAGLSKLFVG